MLFICLFIFFQTWVVKNVFWDAEVDILRYMRLRAMPLEKYWLTRDNIVTIDNVGIASFQLFLGAGVGGHKHSNSLP